METCKFNPYPNQFLNSLDILAHYLMRPWRISVDHGLSCFVPTTKELKTPYAFLASSIVLFPLYVLLLMVTTIPGIFGVLLWLSICHKRSNFRISVCNKDQLAKDYITLNRNYMKSTQVKGKGVFESTPYEFSQIKFTFATLNVCFLQEVLSRYNNLGHTATRADLIGRRIAANQLKFQNTSGHHSEQNGRHLQQTADGDTRLEQNGTCDKTNHLSTTNGETFQRKTYDVTVNDTKSTMDVTVLPEFPDTDFLIFQETWDNKLAECLISHLHQVYPYVVYDAGEVGIEENGYCNNSALLIASKVPIIEVRFHVYPNSHRHLQDKLSAKGLLQVKVYLGQKDGKRKVGLIHTTHLQVFPGASHMEGIHTCKEECGKLTVRLSQLDDIVKWTKEFRSESQEDEIAFDVLAGDFNFDNTSPVDSRDYSHEVFREFRDICRVKPGEDHPFVVGTDMRHTPFYDDLISTPEGLKAVLDDPILRQYYIVNGYQEEEITVKTSRDLTPLDQDGNIIPQPLGGQRRLDYILFKECDHVIPTSYNNVTLLAGLTDHICLSMSLQVNDSK